MRILTPLLWASIVVSAPAAAAPDAKRAVAPGHPIVGKWTWTRIENGCTETYDFRADGTVRVVSGEERSDNSFTIDREPDKEGFYKIGLTMTRDHGGTDCGGSASDDTGQHSALFIRFSPARDTHQVCLERSTDRCLGPLRRIAK